MKSTKPAITVKTTVHVPVEKVWRLWTTAADIAQWNNPSDDWHSPRVEIDLRGQGRFLFRMEAKDGTAGFDHCGKYDKIIPNEFIEYSVDDGRKTIITFLSNGDHTTVTETFEPESETPVEMQRDFCQAILNNFKKYAEEQN